jgi:uncharacterized protein (TIGR03083 family)
LVTDLGPDEMAHMTGLVGSEAHRLHGYLTGLTPEQWLSPSACSGWTVGDVVAHLTQSADTWSQCITRARAGDPSPPPGQQPLQPGDRGSQVMAQRAVALRQEMGQEELLQAFADGYFRLSRVLEELLPQDWGKPCFHRRGPMAVRDYVGLRIQELAIHGWDIRWAFDPAAEPHLECFPVLLTLVPRWLTNTFSRDPATAASGGSIRYRFEVSTPLAVRQDVVVEPESFRLESPGGGRADVTFRCSTGNYFLLIYGRLELEQAVAAGRMAVDGDPRQAAGFNVRFQGV